MPNYQQWEYCELTLYGYEPRVTYFSNPSKSQGFAGFNIVFLQLGQAGWELVSVINTVGDVRDARNQAFYFKRPIMPGRAIDQ